MTSRGSQWTAAAAGWSYADPFLFLRSDVLVWGPFPASMWCLSEKKWPGEGEC